MVITANTDERTAALQRPRRLTASDRDDSNRPEIASSTQRALPATAADVEVLDPTMVRRRLMMADTVATLVGLAVAVGISVKFNSIHGAALHRHLALSAAGLPAFAAGAAINQLHRARANARLSEEMFNIIRTVLIGVGFMVCVAFAVQMKDLSRAWIALIGIWVTSMLMIERIAAREVFLRLRAAGRLRRRVLIVGNDEHAENLYQLLQNDPGLGYAAIGFVGESSANRAQVLGSIDQIEEVLEHYRASGVVIHPHSLLDTEINSMTRRLTDTGYHVAISSALRDIDISRLRPQSIGGHSMLYVEPVARSGAPLIAKRLFDVAAASFILVLTSPVLLVSAIAIKLTSRGPVLFRQNRVGRDGQPFEMLKLRTMVVDAEERLADLADLNEADGPLFKIERDPRVTRVGRTLRKLSIDELPQLVSVVHGTMSLVGPRPALPKEVDAWDEATRDRLRVLPGLTGLWQVSGRSDASFESYKRLDLYYVDNWSLKHDLMICLRTVPVVLGGRGAR